MAQQDVLSRAKAIVGKSPMSVLITIDTNGRPQPRTMWTAGMDEDFTVYFATGRSLEKCRQIEENPKVSVFWTTVENEALGWGYAWIKGNATISDEQSLRNRFWNDELSEYFPKGKEDPSYVIIVIKPKELVVMDSMKYPLDKIEF